MIRDPEKYRAHAIETVESYGFVPIFPDSEGRKLNAEGKSTVKLWVGEVIDTLKYRTFEIPTKEDPHLSTKFGTENKLGDKIDPRFPLGMLSITRVSDDPNPDKIVAALELFMHDKEKAVLFRQALDDEMLSIADITGDGRTKFFSRFDQDIVLEEDIELPPELSKMIGSIDIGLPLFSKMKIMRIYNIGPRTEEFLLSERGIFALENAAA